jgi:hypothetical protein
MRRDYAPDPKHVTRLKARWRRGGARAGTGIKALAANPCGGSCTGCQDHFVEHLTRVDSLLEALDQRAQILHVSKQLAFLNGHAQAKALDIRSPAEQQIDQQRHRLENDRRILVEQFCAGNPHSPACRVH